MIICSDCQKSISEGKKGTDFLTTLVHGPCEICGDREGKKLIYVEKLRTKKPEEARRIMEEFRYWDKFFTKKDDEEQAIFLSEVPAERLKPEVKKVMHLRRGPRNVKCLYAIETEKGIEFIYGYHHDGFCPAIAQLNKLKRR